MFVSSLTMPTREIYYSYPAYKTPFDRRNDSVETWLVKLSREFDNQIEHKNDVKGSKVLIFVSLDWIKYYFNRWVFCTLYTLNSLCKNSYRIKAHWNDDVLFKKCYQVGVLPKYLRSFARDVRPLFISISVVTYLGTIFDLYYYFLISLFWYFIL